MGGSIFFFGGGVKLSKIQFQGIYESNSHSFQSVLVFKNLVVHTLVWIKNGTAQYSDKIEQRSKRFEIHPSWCYTTGGIK